MSDKTLGNARGLNSIADPKQFKGSAGRAKLARRKEEAEPPPPPPPVAETAPPATAEPERPSTRRPAAEERPPTEPHEPSPTERTERAERPDRGATAKASPARKRSSRTSTAATAATAPAERPAETTAPTVNDAITRAAPHRAVQPGVQRKRRELSIPHSVAEELEATGINPADVVMAGYRNHGDAIYAGAGGRLAARGRTRLRLSISDTEFEQLTRLGLARGWNRSETVSVILAMELESRTVTT